jgi:dipeptidyl aminopeptidase/acylaminoacyl peptidase
VLGYPVISFQRFPHQGSIANLLGEDADPALLPDLSPETRVTARTPPTFLWHTGEDEVVAVEHTLLVAEALSGQGVPFETHVYVHGRHGLGLAEGEGRASGWTVECEGWLRDRGWIA